MSVTKRRGTKVMSSFNTNAVLLRLKVVIKTYGSELQGQEKAACMHISSLCNHFCEVFTNMAALKFANVVT